MIAPGGRARELTLASAADEARVRAAGGSDGQGDVLRELRANPLARAELDAEKKRLRRQRISVDHVHLTRYNETDLVQWVGRRADGYHHAMGRLMKILTTA